MADTTVVRASGEGNPIWMLGGLYEIKVAGDESGGSTTVVEMTIPEGSGPPPHIHNGGEVTYIIEGSALYQFNGEKREAHAGTVLYFPKGTVETFEPIGPNPLRILIVYGPGGIDKFFEEAGEAAPRREVPPPLTAPPDVERLAQIASRHGLELRP
jgi:quercetin dioxygenase-like cupin family protein